MRHYIVVDLEMCRVPARVRKESQLNNEIIEIGAVMLDDDFNIVDGFDTYVRPAYGRIDREISKLTGIRQRDVEHAPSLDQAMNAFMEWLPEDDYLIVSWSMSDRRQFANELGVKHVYRKWILNNYADWDDCQKRFGDKMESRRKFRLLDALVASDIVTDGKEHNGMVDAYNTALLYARLNMEPDYKLNTYYLKALETEENEVLQFSLADSLKGLCLDTIVA